VELAPLTLMIYDAPRVFILQNYSGHSASLPPPTATELMLSRELTRSANTGLSPEWYAADGNLSRTWLHATKQI
jgi:hypothetical protein